MSDRKAQVLKAGLEALYYTGAHRWIAPRAQGIGLIFMLHQVSPEPVPEFAPNRILKVTPDFLDAVLAQVREAGLDIVTLDEAADRIRHADPRRFVCFTLDDGYRDNLEHAAPVFRAHEAPFTVYVPSSFPSGEGELWWLALERVIAEQDRIEIAMDGAPETLTLGSVAEKCAAYDRVYWWLRRIEEDAQRDVMRDLCARYDVDLQALCRALIMSWDEIAELARDPLVTIGAHTAGHYAVAKLSADAAHREMEEGAAELARRLGTRPAHFSYPYGDPASAGPRDFDIAQELGFKTAVTTRKGVLFPEHAAHMTALPRVSLNGDYQSLKYTELYLSGAPFALWNGFRKVNVT